MSDKKPNVFPTEEQVKDANSVKVAPQNQGQSDIPDPISKTEPSASEHSAAEEMRRNTAEQLKLRNHAVSQTQSSVDEGSRARAELMAEMDKAKQVQPQEQTTPKSQQEIIEGAMSYEDMVKFQTYMNQVDNKKTNTQVEVPPSSQFNAQVPSQPPYQPPVVPPVPPSNVGQPNSMQEPEDPSDVYIRQLSEPQINSAFDVIPLPSEGKLYKNKKKSIRVAYMSTADENILTSPNLLSSGKFLEILMNRKILEPDLRYNDLIEGDRDAIMLWLRATGYGNMYPITVQGDDEVPFDTEVDLNEIKTIPLTKEPDINGHFDFKLPVSGIQIKYKLLTVGEVEVIGEKIEYEMNVLNIPVNNSNTYALAKQIVSINGDTNEETIGVFSENMRVGDSKALRNEMNSIRCGVDMNITVGTPGGGSLDTFLPLNLKFFWPDLGV